MVKGIQMVCKKYQVPHITISPYNSQVDGLVERQHWDVRKALMKMVAGNERQWWKAAPVVFWAERLTTQKATGYSPYYLAHGVEPLLPFNIVEAMYLAPLMALPMTSADLLALCAHQLMKRKEDLAMAATQVIASSFCSAEVFVRAHKRTIKDYDFKQGDLVLVCNTQVEKEMYRKRKDRYLGPMVVVSRHQSGLYTLAKLDGQSQKPCMVRFASYLTTLGLLCFRSLRLAKAATRSMGG